MPYSSAESPSFVSGQVSIPPVPRELPPVPQVEPWADGSLAGEVPAAPYGKQHTELVVRGEAKRRSSSVARSWLPWLVALACAGAAAFVFVDARDQRGALAGQVSELEAELESANARAAAAEKEAREAGGELARATESLEATESKLEAVEATVAKKAAAASELEAKLNSLLEEGQGEVLVGKDGRLTLQLVDKVLFRSGEAELTARGEKVMARVGQALSEMKDKQIWVQGHTDRKPIKKNSGLFASNWELSSARALTVVHYLQDESKVNPRRLAATAFSSYRPVSKRNLAKNRRIEIVLMPRDIRLRR